MKSIKDFFGFWVNWYKENWKVFKTKDCPLIEDDLTLHDIRYIENKQTGYLRKLWIKLDNIHNQYFKEKESIFSCNKQTRLYSYEGEEYNIKELSLLSWLPVGTLYWRIAKWLSIRKAMTTPKFTRNLKH